MGLFSQTISVAIEIDLQLAPDVEHGAANSIGDNIDWSAVSEEVLLNYLSCTNRYTVE